MIHNNNDGFPFGKALICIMLGAIVALTCIVTETLPKRRHYTEQYDFSYSSPKEDASEQSKVLLSKLLSDTAGAVSLLWDFFKPYGVVTEEGRLEITRYPDARTTITIRIWPRSETGGYSLLTHKYRSQDKNVADYWSLTESSMINVSDSEILSVGCTDTLLNPPSETNVKIVMKIATDHLQLIFEDIARSGLVIPTSQ